MEKLLAGLFLLPAALSAQVLLTDDFNAGAIDSSRWNIQNPYADSSVIEGSGYLQVQNRGQLISAAGFSTPYVISGDFQLSNNEFSNAKIVIRSDGESPGMAELNGIAIQFQVRGDSAYARQLSIFTIGAPVESSASVSLDVPLSLDTWYAFEIYDWGDSVELYWDGASSATLTLDSSYSAGDLLGFYNREGAAGGSGISANGIARLDSITVSQVPEPDTYAVILSLFSLSFVILGYYTKSHSRR